MILAGRRVWERAHMSTRVNRTPCWRNHNAMKPLETLTTMDFLAMLAHKLIISGFEYFSPSPAAATF